MSRPVNHMRLDRLLANMGYGSRRDVQQWVRAKAILLDGEPLGDADERIAVLGDLPLHLTVRGEPVDPPPGMVVMMHKPLGATCSHKEAGALVYDLLPERWRRRKPAISTVGRLDKETSGLLLLTDDGDLLHWLISPRSRSPKRYVATLARPLAGTEASLFASGTMMLENEDRPLLPVELEQLAPQIARVTLMEGRYHQVRRMFAASGNHVVALHRDRIAGLDLPADLVAGSYRLLRNEELAAIGG